MNSSKAEVCWNAFKRSHMCFAYPPTNKSWFTLGDFDINTCWLAINWLKELKLIFPTQLLLLYMWVCVLLLRGYDNIGLTVFINITCFSAMVYGVCQTEHMEETFLVNPALVLVIRISGTQKGKVSSNFVQQ